MRERENGCGSHIRRRPLNPCCGIAREYEQENWKALKEALEKRASEGGVQAAPAQ